MKTTGLFIILTFGLLSLQAQPGSYKWVNVSPFDDAYEIKGQFISENEGWVFQNHKQKRRELYYTNDGARSFSKYFSATDTLISSLHMFASKNGLAIFENSSGGSSWNWTKDGGKSWFQIYFNYGTNGVLTSIIDTNTYIFSIRDTENQQIILKKTDDRGQTWHVVNYPIYQLDGETKLIYSPTNYYFLNDSIGWICGGTHYGYGCILQTTDRGENWKIIYERSTDVYGAHFFDSVKGICHGRGDISSVVEITNNNFSTVSNLYVWNFDYGYYPNDVYYLNDTTLWVVGEGSIYFSTNTGQSFSRYPNIDETFSGNLKKIQFFNKTGYIFGTNNTLLKLIDTTATTIEQINTLEEYSIFPNPVTNFLTIENKTPVALKYIIYNSQGKTVLQGEAAPLQYMQIPAATWPAGVYFIKTGATRPYKKIIKL